MLKNRKVLGRRSFFGGLRNWGPTHLTCELSICWGGTDLGTHAHWGAPVPPFGMHARCLVKTLVEKICKHLKILDYLDFWTIYIVY